MTLEQLGYIHERPNTWVKYYPEDYQTGPDYITYNLEDEKPYWEKTEVNHYGYYEEGYFTDNEIMAIAEYLKSKK